MPVFYFCHSTTGCTDSANIRCRNVMRPRILYRAAKNAISCCQECYICQCVYLELKAGSQYAWASVATGSAYKLIWTHVATFTYAGIELFQHTRRASKSFCMHFRSQRDAGKLRDARPSVCCEPALTVTLVFSDS